MDTAKVSSLLDDFLESSPGSDQRIREFFVRTAETALVIKNQNTALVSLEECVPDSPQSCQNHENSRDFYARFMKEERQKYMKLLKEHRNEMFCDDYYLNSNTSQQIIDQDGIFDKKSPWGRLCILDYQAQILKTIHENRIVIIKGFTGCGKSTQIPQYLAMDCQKQGQPYSIIVTQPRRVAAKMLATRVASELDCPLGSLVGYQIGLDQAKSNQKTRILYVTTGVLLQRLIMSSGLKQVTHIILDEVHERSADMDMLFLALKRKIFACDLNVKIILMSATCNVDLFQEYFTLPKYISDTTCIDCSPAVLEIRDSSIGSTIKRFKQEIFYLDDIVGKIEDLQSTLKYIENSNRYYSYKEFLRQSSTQMIFNKNYPTVHQALHDAVLAILFHQIEAHQLDNQNRGTVLIFLPGLAEILDLMKVLSDSPLSERFKWQFSILHSTVSLQEQTDVLRVVASGWRHIILATNIAESSLTVPNIEFVIDFCLCKVLMASRQGYSMTYLSLQWSSQSSSDQRAGRTGRTNHGQVFRLIPRRFYKTLEQFDVPEFERTPLENYVLKAKLIDDSLPPKKVLAYALSPPALEDIESSLLALKRTNALTVTTTTACCRTPSQELMALVSTEEESESGYESAEGRDETTTEVYQRDDGNLTALGYIMAMLPMDLKLSKLVALGVVFDCTYEAVIIAAAHCTSGFFVQNAFNPLRSYKSHLEWAGRSFSDSLAYLRAYRAYKAMKNTFQGVMFLPKIWCQSRNIDYLRLLEMETLVSEVINRLEMNLKVNCVRPTNYPQSEQDLILKVIIAGAFYPNYFLRHYADADLLEKYQSSSVDFNDTVILNGFTNDTAISSLYVPLLHQLFQGCSPNIEYRVDGSTVYMKMDIQSPSTAGIDLDGFDNNNGGDHHLQQLPKTTSSTTAVGQSSDLLLSCSESSVHSSVYHALAVKKLKPLQKLNRFRPEIEDEQNRDLYNREVILRSDNIRKTVDEGQFTHETFPLRGPTSPLEVVFCPLPRMNFPQRCYVAPSSVNCVALEPNVSSARHARLLVAGEITLAGSRRERFSLGHTTLMPNSIDFPVLMCMLWAPRVELRVNKLLSERTYGLPEELCGALCGVGFDPSTGVSYDPDTDMELLFDSSVTAQDIELLNLLRYQVSQFFKAKHQHITSTPPQWTSIGERLQRQQSLGLAEQCLAKRQQMCRQTLLQLLNRTRFPRHWFQRGSEWGAKPTRVSPTYHWSMFSSTAGHGGHQTPPYRAFHFHPLSQPFPENINPKKAVLKPISIPILNEQTGTASTTTTTTTSSWEDIVLQNLNSLETNDFEPCKDTASNLYICKLCMIFTFACSDMQLHCHNDEHTEASRLFRKYIVVSTSERALAQAFASASYEEERALERVARGEEEELGEQFPTYHNALQLVKYTEPDVESINFDDQSTTSTLPLMTFDEPDDKDEEEKNDPFTDPFNDSFWEEKNKDLWDEVD